MPMLKISAGHTCNFLWKKLTDQKIGYRLKMLRANMEILFMMATLKLFKSMKRTTRTLLIFSPFTQKMGQFESLESRKLNNLHLRAAKIFWRLLLAPWRLLFTFVPLYQIAHGWIAFICSLAFIGRIAYIVTKLTDQISYVTGINAYVIEFTALAAGTSWSDLVASKIPTDRQTTADSAIANITCRSISWYLWECIKSKLAAKND